MDGLSKAVQAGILSEPLEVMKRCEKQGIFKPHLYSAFDFVGKDDNDFTLADLKVPLLLELDEQFLKDTIGKKMQNAELFGMRKILELTRYEWFTRLPTWLENKATAKMASKAYYEKIVNSPYTPWFRPVDCPSFSDVIDTLRPKVVGKTILKTILGDTTVSVKLAPTLKPEDVQQIVTNVINLKDADSKQTMSMVNINAHVEFFKFLQDGTIPEDTGTRISLAFIAASPTPHLATFRIFMDAATNLDLIDSKMLTTVRSKALDLDVKMGILNREDGSPVLTSRQFMNLLSKKFKRDGKTKVLNSRNAYYEDYSIFEGLRYVPDPGKALDYLLESADYYKFKEEAA